MTATIDDVGIASTAAEAERSAVTPNIGHVLLIALLVGAFGLLWLVAYELLVELVWGNLLSGQRWAIPVGAVFFSLLVGLLQRYMRAPDVAEGGIEKPLKAQDVATYKTFWGSLLSSFCSLLSGASIGPEGCLGMLAVEVAQWIATKLKFTKQGVMVAALAGMSSAYNGIIGNPVFATLLGTEASGSKGGLALVGVNLVAGVVGFLVFTLVGVPAFAGSLNVGQPAELTLRWVLWAVGLGLVGALVAAFMGVALRGMDRVMGVFKERVIERALVAGVVVGVVCYFIPDLMFSGQKSIQYIVSHPAEYGLWMLLLMAILKPLLLALSLKGGYLGGPIFPTLFTAMMVGLAISLLAPGVPLSILLVCPTVGVVTLALHAPLTAILLVALLTGAGDNSDMIGLVAVSAATALVAGMVLQGRRARRSQAQLAEPSAAV
jgi:H+/Cl- antiporter ClcA